MSGTNVGRSSRERVLVTGANGFVGTTVTTALLSAGFAVRQVVRRIPVGHARNEVLEIGDIGAPLDWSAAVSEVDAIIHLANRAHQRQRSLPSDLDFYRQTNVRGTMGLAAAAARSGVKRFVYVSSIHVNGLRTEGRAFIETDAPAPSEPYAISKWEAEQELRRLERSSRLQVTIVRPPLVHGPGVKGNLLRLLKLVRGGWPLPLGSLDNSRSLIGVHNLADLLVCCISHPQAGGSLFLASDGKDISTPELIRLLASAMRRPVRLFNWPPRSLRLLAAVLGQRSTFDRISESLQVDSTHVRDVLGWRPPLTLEEGFHRMGEWFEKDGA